MVTYCSNGVPILTELGPAIKGESVDRFKNRRLAYLAPLSAFIGFLKRSSIRLWEKRWDVEEPVLSIDWSIAATVAFLRRIWSQWVFFSSKYWKKRERQDPIQQTYPRNHPSSTLSIGNSPISGSALPCRDSVWVVTTQCPKFRGHIRNGQSGIDGQCS